MNYKILKSALAGGLLIGLSATAMADVVVMSTPDNFQVLDISANGKWACGVFVDAAASITGFRWNLESGTIEMLSFNDESLAWGIANDGTVSGEFTDRSHTPNGGGVTLPGFYRDGKWHSVELPAGTTVLDGQGGGVSPDGRFMTGEIGGVGYIWENGKISRRLEANTTYMRPYCISPDGKAAAGWAYGEKKQNRACIYWPPTGTPIWLMDADDGYNEGMFNHCQKFSPNGKWITYWGGYNWYEDTKEAYLYSLYNVETDERTRLKLPSESSAVEFFSVSDNGTLVGELDDMGYVYTDGKFVSVYDYLKERGYDLWDFDGFYNGDNNPYGDDFPPVSRVIGISGDEKVLCMLYYSNRTAQVASLVVKLDEDRYHMPAVDLSGRQLEGLNTVEISWNFPIGFLGTRANIYRDGVKINGRRAVEGRFFYDSNVEPGVYEYEVRLVNTGEEEIEGEKFTVEVTTGTPPEPYGLLSRQKGVNNALMVWNAPMSNLTHKAYYNRENPDYAPFSIYQDLTVEMGVRYDSNELANYEGHSIREISFIPLGEHSNWTVNIYTVGADNSLTKVYSQDIDQEITPRTLNTVALDTPYQIQKNNNIIVALQVDVNATESAVLAAQYGKVKPGYSDLMRQIDVDDAFFSTYESSVEGTYHIYSMSWMIDLGLAKAGAENESISGYNVYLNGELQGNTTDCRYEFKALPKGSYEVGIEALYGDVASGRTLCDLEIKDVALPAVDTVNVMLEDESSEIVATWDAPQDRDPYSVSYTTQEKAERGITGLQSSNYSIMVGARYPANMLRSYEGYRISNLRFYPLADAIYTILLYENNDLLYEEEVADFSIGKWNEVIPSEDLFINANSDYFLVVDVYDPEPEVAVIGLDNQVSVPQFSDLYSVDAGETFDSFYDATSMRGNFMIGMTAVSTNPEELEVEGYDVVIDGKLKNKEKVTEREFKYDFGQGATADHRISVDVYYPGVNDSVYGADNYFHLKTSGVDMNEVVEITLRKGDNYLVADGDGVNGISVISTDGRVLAASFTNKVDITNLVSGVYVVVIDTAEGKISRKLQITK